MTANELRDTLLTLEIPVAHLAFGKKAAPPFIQYGFPRRGDFMANNARFYGVNVGWLEVYAPASKMLLTIMPKVEALLTQAKIYWEKENEDYIDSEKLAYARYAIMIIGG